MLEIQKYLRDGNETFEDKLKYLQEQLNLNIKVQDNKILLNYRIDSSKQSTIVNECRGLILSVPDFNIVCFPFRRFYNYGEGFASQIDWSSAYVQDKIDGTLCSAYFDWPFSKEWKVSTRNMIYAEGAINQYALLGDSKSFAFLFWEIFTKERIKELDVKNTYSFELVSPENKIVKRYSSRELYLLLVRDNVSLQEKSIDSVRMFRVDCLKVSLPSQYHFNNLEQVIEMTRKLKPDDEGYVVVDKDFNRIKVKNPAYFALSAIKNNGNVESNLVKFIVKGEKTEFLSYFPEFKERYENLELRYNDLLMSAEELYNKTKDLELQKDFALAVLPHRLSSFLFMVRKGIYTNVKAAAHDNEQLIEKVLCDSNIK